MIKVIIDNQEIKTKEGEKILWVALDNGIYIPHLCALREKELPFAGCRLCFVETEIQGKKRLSTSCSEPAKDGMIILTNTEKINCLRRSAFELIMTDHYIDCKNCVKKKSCELIKIATYLKVKIKPQKLKSVLKEKPIDTSHPKIIYNPNKCIKCGKCVFVCDGILNFSGRGFETEITTFNKEPLALSGCVDCEKCIYTCPTGALSKK